MSDNDHLQRQINDLKAKIDAPYNKIVARYGTDAAQSIPNDTWTIVNFDTKVLDTHNRVTTGAAWKFTASKNMYVAVSAFCLFASSTAWAMAEHIDLKIYLNGADYCSLDRRSAVDTSGTSQHLGIAGSDTVSLSAGDYLAITIYQNTGGAVLLHNSTKYNHVAIAEI